MTNNSVLKATLCRGWQCIWLVAGWLSLNAAVHAEDVGHSSAAGSGASSPQPRLVIPFPEGWELKPVKMTDRTLYLLARQRRGEVVVQQLQLTATNLNPAAASVTPESLETLAMQLRDATQRTAAEKTIPLQVLSGRRGYYFSATDRAPKPGDYPQMVEGVMLASGYLINFTLLTHEVHGSSAKQAVAALDALKIE